MTDTPPGSRQGIRRRTLARYGALLLAGSMGLSGMSQTTSAATSDAPKHPFGSETTINAAHYADFDSAWGALEDLPANPAVFILPESPSNRYYPSDPPYELPEYGTVWGPSALIDTQSLPADDHLFRYHGGGPHTRKGRVRVDLGAIVGPPVEDDPDGHAIDIRHAFLPEIQVRSFNGYDKSLRVHDCRTGLFHGSNVGENAASHGVHMTRSHRCRVDASATDGEDSATAFEFDGCRDSLFDCIVTGGFGHGVVADSSIMPSTGMLRVVAHGQPVGFKSNSGWSGGVVSLNLDSTDAEFENRRNFVQKNVVLSRRAKHRVVAESGFAIGPGEVEPSVFRIWDDGTGELYHSAVTIDQQVIPSGYVQPIQHRRGKYLHFGVKEVGGKHGASGQLAAAPV